MQRSFFHVYKGTINIQLLMILDRCDGFKIWTIRKGGNDLDNSICEICIKQLGAIRIDINFTCIFWQEPHMLLLVVICLNFQNCMVRRLKQSVY